MSPKNLITLTLTALFLITLSACSKETIPVPNKTAAEKNLPPHILYKNWHDVCLKGEIDAIQTQIQKFETRIHADPNDNLARAYLGSSYALKAKASKWPPTKLKSLKLAKQLLETAVKNDPKNNRVRMVRSIAYYKVPERFDCRATSIADFEILYNNIKNKSSGMAPNEQQATLYYASLAFHEANHNLSTPAKTLCHKLDPKSEYGKLTK